MSTADITALGPDGWMSTAGSNSLDGISKQLEEFGGNTHSELHKGSTEVQALLDDMSPLCSRL